MTAADEARDGLVAALGDLVDAVVRMERHRDASVLLDPQGQADTIALVTDLRQRLAALETDLATALGKVAGPIQGNLSDGRQFTLKRSAERKAWNHDEWKHDVRRAIVQNTLGDTDHVLQSVNMETGEVVETPLTTVLHEALAQAQEVHGSTDPRTTSLKRLGLYAGDYCESRPGGWRFQAIKPTQPAPDTTTQEN